MKNSWIENLNDGNML
jgi:hypothetical protein